MVHFTPSGFDILRKTNMLMEIDAKLNEISTTINAAITYPSLNDYDLQFLEIQKNLFFFYSDFSRLIEQSNAGKSDKHKMNLEFGEFLNLEEKIYQELWQLYKTVITQRTNKEMQEFLEAGDIIAQSMFDEFLRNEKLATLKPKYFTYSKPLTFLGSYNRYEYYTLFPELLNQYKMAVPIISISRSASGVIWYLLAIPHEIGHDIMGNIPEFQKEANQVIMETFKKTNYTIKPIKMPVYDKPSGILVERDFNSNEIMQIIWTAYLSETFADIMGILLSGPAFLISSLELLGGSKNHEWLVEEGGPEEHPPSYLRAYMQNQLLMKLKFSPEVEEINDIFEFVSGLEDVITWKSNYSIPGMNSTFELDIEIMEDSAKRVVDALTTSSFKSLGNNSLMDLVTPFQSKDQQVIVKLAERLTVADWMIDISGNYHEIKPKHILAASRWAANANSSKASVIHDTAMKMILKNKEKW